MYNYTSYVNAYKPYTIPRMKHLATNDEIKCVIILICK